jgi:uncharacterized Zn finger protein
MRWGDRYYFPVSKPKEAKGGIRSRSQRGAFASRWWARRWLAVLDALNLGARLQRARSYARRGQVLDIRIAPGRVTAKVQGSRPKPYDVEIGVDALGGAAVQKLTREIAGVPWVLAKLLTQQMPEEIEEVAARAGVSLFPARASELRTDCSCPDWSNPCKHIAAVYYLLGEEFDRDPFLIFTLRGVDTAALLGSLGGISGEEEEEVEEASEEERLIAGEAPPENFWDGARAEVTLTASAPARHPAPLLERLGSLPFWRGAQPLPEAVRPACSAAIDAALDLIAGTRK